MKFTIGADPELFLKNDAGRFISAVGLIGGDKWNPKPISPQGHAILEDNVAVEFNIPPSEDASTFVSHLNFVLQHLEGQAKKLNLHLVLDKASMIFDDEQLNSPGAQTFGCEPDWNAWTGKVNKKPYANNPNLRSCGGHVHVGTHLEPFPVIQAMDLFLGIPSLHLDKDTQRRELYGKAGACRVKPYGAEYRTLSNFWLQSDDLKEWVYKQTQKAIDFVAEGRSFSARHGLAIRRAINMADMETVSFIERQYKEIYA